MGEVTGIGWTDHTFNPWIGCTKVSPACDNCYAADMAARYGWAKWGDHPRQRTAAGTWKQPLAWNRKVPQGETRFVFCASLADVFDNQAPPEWRADLFALIRATPNLTWLLLTKRIGNAARMAEEAGGWPANAAAGATVVTQEEADRDVPKLLVLDGPRFRFLSIEPMLGPIDLQRIDDGEAHRDVPRNEWGAVDDDDSPPALWWDSLTGKRAIMHGGATGEWCRYDAHLDWVICGGESGSRVRSVRPEWVASLRDQCTAAGIPFFFKQWGGRTPKANGKTIDGREYCDRPTPSRPPATRAPRQIEMESEHG